MELEEIRAKKKTVKNGKLKTSKFLHFLNIKCDLSWNMLSYCHEMTYFLFSYLRALNSEDWGGLRSEYSGALVKKTGKNALLKKLFELNKLIGKRDVNY